MSRLETTRVKLGFVPLTDCAPLVVAAEKGFFAAEGLDVELVRQASWASLRDRLALGLVDGAHILGPLPLAMSMGLDGLRRPMIVGMALEVNGNAISISRVLHDRLREIDPLVTSDRRRVGAALRQLVRQDQQAGRPPLTFGSVYGFSCHTYELSHWLAANGIAPGRDIRLAVVPPFYMVEQLATGAIDGFCIADPWHSLALSSGVGVPVAVSEDIWASCIEKVFAVTAEWDARHPKTHRAVLAAIGAAAEWADNPANRREVAALLSASSVLNVPAAIVERSLTNGFRFSESQGPADLPDFHIFHGHCATFPWRSQAEWFIANMMRWGHAPEDTDAPRVAADIYRTDIWREVARERGWPAPLMDMKAEGAHRLPWMLPTDKGSMSMKPDGFIDGRIFQPGGTRAWLADVGITRTEAPTGETRRTVA